MEVSAVPHLHSIDPLRVGKSPRVHRHSSLTSRVVIVAINPVTWLAIVHQNPVKVFVTTAINLVRNIS